MKKTLSFIVFSLIFFWFSFAWWLYNLHSVWYTYWCNGNDNWWDSCWYWEINLKNHRWGASSAGSYICWKIDTTAPSISISWIKPEKQWVNIENYNPIKDIKIEVTDAGAWVRYIQLVIWTKTLTWDFWYGNKKSSFIISYSNICSKTWLWSDCYKKLFLEWKNDIKVTAYDAVYSYRNGAQAPSNSNKWFKSTQIWVDNSRPTYTLNWDKAYNSVWLVNNNQDSKWKNKTLIISNNVADKYGEWAWIQITTETCIWKPSNSIWTMPDGVDPNTWKFKSYNGNPSTSDCKWTCNIWYIRDGNNCIKKTKSLNCKSYLENKWYNLSNVDGEKLYFVLEGWIVNKKTGVYTWVYDVETHKYLPLLENCKLKWWVTQVSYDAKDANGKPTKVYIDANLLITNTNPLNVIPDRWQKSCGVLWNLVDFNNWNGNNWWNWDIKANYIYKLLPNYGGWYYDGKDHNQNSLVNDKNEFELWYKIVDANNVEHEDKDITKVCWEKTCVANSKELDSSNCKCIAWYYPIDATTDKVWKYSKCIKLWNNQCLKDTNSDWYLDTIQTLWSNQIVNLKNIVYSTDKVPECGQVCSNWYAKDTNGDGRNDSCASNWECGSSKNSCSAWKFKDVADSSDYYKWKCLGVGWGNDVSCSIHKEINWKCGSSKNSCSAWKFKDIADSSDYYKWKCLWEYGGSDVSCSVKKWTCGKALTVNISWKTYTYTTKKMPDGHCWTSENMKHPPKNLTNSWSNWNSYKTWWWPYKGNESNSSNWYGYLYTWRAAMGCTNSSCNSENLTNSVCWQLGAWWHLPSDQDLKNLEKKLWCTDYNDTWLKCKWLWFNSSSSNKKLWGLINKLPWRRVDDNGKYMYRNVAWIWWNTYSNWSKWWDRYFFDDSDKRGRYWANKWYWYAVICVKN